MKQKTINIFKNLNRALLIFVFLVNHCLSDKTELKVDLINVFPVCKEALVLPGISISILRDKNVFLVYSFGPIGIEFQDGYTKQG